MVCERKDKLWGDSIRVRKVVVLPLDKATCHVAAGQLPEVEPRVRDVSPILAGDALRDRFELFRQVLDLLDVVLHFCRGHLPRLPHEDRE